MIFNLIKIVNCKKSNRSLFQQKIKLLIWLMKIVLTSPRIICCLGFKILSRIIEVLFNFYIVILIISTFQFNNSSFRHLMTTSDSLVCISKPNLILNISFGIKLRLLFKVIPKELFSQQQKQRNRKSPPRFSWVFWTKKRPNSRQVFLKL